jgi:hypothetical protein
MNTITVTNLSDTPVAGETDLRQAVAEAKSGDTIVGAGTAGANLTIDFGDSSENEIVGSIIVDAGATATIANAFIVDEDIGAASSRNRPAGAGAGHSPSTLWAGV